MKYLIYNDISYLLHKQKWVLIIIFFVPLFNLLLKIDSSSYLMDIFLENNGVNLTLDSYDVFQMIMYLFNIFTFLFLVIDIYIKDLSNNLENIFLRVKATKYILLKNLCFTITVIVIKLLQYLFLIGVTSIFNHNFEGNQFLLLILSDTVYILLLQYISLFVYLLFVLIRKNKLLLLIIVLVLLYIFPKNIWESRYYIIYELFILVILQAIIYILFFKKKKSLIENV